jgi:hypothetical protein
MKKIKKFELLALILPGLIVAVYLVWVYAIPKSGTGKTPATKEQFDKIQVGMSEEEVEEILGPPTKKTTGWGTLKNGDHAPIILPYHYAGVGGAVLKIDFYVRKVYAKQWIGAGG